MNASGPEILKLGHARYSVHLLESTNRNGLVPESRCGISVCCVTARQIRSYNIHLIASTNRKRACSRDSIWHRCSVSPQSMPGLSYPCCVVHHTRALQLMRGTVMYITVHERSRYLLGRTAVRATHCTDGLTACGDQGVLA